MHTSVNLQVHEGLPAKALCRSGEVRDVVLVVGGADHPVVYECDRIVGGLLAQHENRRVDAGFAQFDGFLRERHAQSARACGECCPGDGQGSMSVGIGLHHRPGLGRRGDARDDLHVVAQGGKVDRCARGTCGTHGTCGIVHAHGTAGRHVVHRACSAPTRLRRPRRRGCRCG